MKIYLSALLIAVVLLVSHLFGLDGLYWNFIYYDVFMHILGGIAIGIFVYALVRSFKPNWLSKKTLLVLLVLFIGLAWELFEIYYNIAGHPVGTKLYYIDTLQDLVNDIIGGSLAIWLCARINR